MYIISCLPEMTQHWLVFIKAIMSPTVLRMCMGHTHVLLKVCILQLSKLSFSERKVYTANYNIMYNP